VTADDRTADRTLFVEHAGTWIAQHNGTVIAASHDRAVVVAAARAHPDRVTVWKVPDGGAVVDHHWFHH
jgi:hypothetical protein